MQRTLRIHGLKQVDFEDVYLVLLKNCRTFRLASFTERKLAGALSFYAL